MFADISFPISSYKVFVYRIPEKLEHTVEVGVRVRVPFGKRTDQGVVVSLFKKSKFKGKILFIKSVVDETPIFDATLWKLLNWVSDYYLTPIGQVMSTAVPKQLNLSYKPMQQLMVHAGTISQTDLDNLSENAPVQFKVMRFLLERDGTIPVAHLNRIVTNVSSICNALEKKGYVSIQKVPRIPDLSSLSLFPRPKEVKFTKEQQGVITRLSDSMDAKRFQSFLLHGVTGSGKTEIYLQLAKMADSKGRASIILLPEISLTPQIAGRFQAEFGDRIAIWHSQMSPAERAWTWRQICSGAYSVVVGARSSIFSPLKNVGLIIVDEEQESSYKQESPAPRYHARNVALMRGKLSGALTVLSSATPSMESYYNQVVGKIYYLRLKRRFGGAKYPQVHMVDMIEERKKTEDYKTPFSRLLKDKIEDRLKKGEQVILLQNRRGFSPIVSCRDCGYVEMCRNCQISLTYHKVGNILRCHYCNFEKPTSISCRECQGSRLMLGGIGTQKVEEALVEYFPQMRLVRMDWDTTRKKGAYVHILRDFGNGVYDVLLGTQMIAKGLDFDNVTLVGIINADTGLFLPDFRAGERTFQLIYQVAGRSGRGEKPGEVVIQTNNSDSPVIKTAARLDLKKYYNICLSERRELDYAPFSWMARVEFSGKDKGNVRQVANEFTKSLQKKPKSLQVLGPAPCPFEKIRGNYRFQIIFKSPKEKDRNGTTLHNFLKKNLLNSSRMKRRKGVNLHVDVDPISLL